MFVTPRAIRDVMHVVNTTALTNAFVLGIPFLKKNKKTIPGINSCCSKLVSYLIVEKSTLLKQKETYRKIK